MNLPEKFTTPGNKGLSASEVANNLRIISNLLSTTIDSSDSSDPAIKIILEDFRIKLQKKVNKT